jgi:protein TonB
MVVHPLESVGARNRSLRSAIPSVVVHAAIILAAVHATAHAALPKAPTPVTVGPLVFVPPRPSEPPRTSAATPSHSRTRRFVAPVPIDGVHPFVPPTTIPDHVPAIPVGAVTLTIGRREFGDGIAHDGSNAGGPRAGGVLTGVEVDRQVEPLPGAPAPEYPDALRAAGVRGSVLAEFVVDTTGHMEPGSFRALRSDNPLFAEATRAALLRTLFRPAESSGRRVRQLVQQRFSFVLH